MGLLRVPRREGGVSRPTHRCERVWIVKRKTFVFNVSPRSAFRVPTDILRGSCPRPSPSGPDSWVGSICTTHGDHESGSRVVRGRGSYTKFRGGGGEGGRRGSHPVVPTGPKTGVAWGGGG